MLKEIEIQNFRCFEQIKISGFERINLIGGKNNAGKTALLEALFLKVAPELSSIAMLRELRIEAYDKARFDDKDSEILKAFQLIDPTIESVESFSIGEPTLYLRRKGEKRLPLSLFGDAMNRVAYIMLKLVNNQHKILLIDEIENGIHYY